MTWGNARGVGLRLELTEFMGRIYFQNLSPTTANGSKVRVRIDMAAEGLKGVFFFR
jgi:hypothetical protein